LFSEDKEECTRAKKHKYSALHFILKELIAVPAEIKDREKFIQLSENATYCAVKRLAKTVKLKLRTPKLLYTLKTDPSRAEEIIKKLRCEIQEI